MPGTASYFDTRQFSSANPNGLWNISHSELNRRVWLDSGMKIGTYAEKAYGMTWIELRAEMKRLFTSTVNDHNIINRVKKLTNRFIPVRTGKLMDVIFKTMRIFRNSFYSSRYIVKFEYEYPQDRPRFITNPSHSPPSRGYGDWATYRLVTAEAQRRVQIDHITPMGNALYILNDPLALNKPEDYIDYIAQQELRDDYDTKFNIVLQIRM